MTSKLASAHYPATSHNTPWTSSTRRAAFAAALDDDIAFFDGTFEWLAVIPGYVGAGGAGIALRGMGV